MITTDVVLLLWFIFQLIKPCPSNLLYFNHFHCGPRTLHPRTDDSLRRTYLIFSVRVNKLFICLFPWVYTRRHKTPQKISSWGKPSWRDASLDRGVLSVGRVWHHQNCPWNYTESTDIGFQTKLISVIFNMKITVSWVRQTVCRSMRKNVQHPRLRGWRFSSVNSRARQPNPKLESPLYAPVTFDTSSTWSWFLFQVF